MKRFFCYGKNGFCKEEVCRQQSCDFFDDSGGEMREEETSPAENEIGKGHDCDRLRELVEADRDGRCVVLPCKVGDTVYLLNHHLGRIFENVVSSFSVGYGSNNKNTINTVYIGECGSKTFRKWKFQQIGKTVFLDHEAAEAALKGGSDGV
ncbi:MAG: hypothetical protein ACOX7M_06330 [Dysosmobacter sp.]|uniref:hypothetical protein n=1 Tax=Dysosmobacter sp. TaxID=2591382 RepID=UPI003D911521